MSTNNQQKAPTLEIWAGIECTINRVGEVYFDQLQYAGHYERPTDITLLAELGISRLRYPVLWEKHQPQRHIAPDFSWISSQLQNIKNNNIIPVVGLLHHGSGPAFTHLLDPDFPYLFADYALEVARAFPWVNYYTPVNEPLTTARFSGLYGFWYPHQCNDRAFLQILLHELKGTVLAMQAIRTVNPQAQLVQTEDLAKTYSTPLLQYQADFENARRWLTLDILCGKVNKTHPLWNYFKKHDLEQELTFFQAHKCPPDIIGWNYYITSERYLDEAIELYPEATHGSNDTHWYADVEAVRVPLLEKSGLPQLLTEAWNRFQLPMAITEVHLHCTREEQLRWFKQVYDTCRTLQQRGINLKGITAWAALGSFGWNKLLTEPYGEYEPGVYDVRSGKPRPTALAHFIRNITKATAPLLREKGWWERPERFLFTKPLRQTTQSFHSSAAPILILGKSGTLGRACARLCKERNIPFILLSRLECDITDYQTVASIIECYKPWAVINAAGYVRVDDAETDLEQCLLANAVGAQVLANICQGKGIRLVTYSSDLVFDGTKAADYQESDPVNPLNVYGASKAQSEQLVAEANPQALIIRTSSFFSPWDTHNFARHVITHLEDDRCLSVAEDVWSSPTYVPDLVNASLDLLIDEESGIWHLANQGSVSWYEFARHIAEYMQLNPALIEPTAQSELGWKALRPRYTG
ncbi:MAG: family 1 glycosylhydrolase, partial [Saprospiraceae bacterium]